MQGVLRAWDVFHPVAKICFGLVFIWAGWNKFLDPHTFAELISNYKLLPAFAVNPVAIILPWVEIAAGVMLVTGIRIGGSLVILDLLLMIFALALIINLQRGLVISCGCFTLDPEGERIAWTTLARDLVLLVLGLSIAFRELCIEQKKVNYHP
ncbi:MAG: DoxX family membrane protein [Deltaproteobacteria bacterium]|nr:DoxX family membrane protein [Deltaproteobacteria bacterium]